MESVKYYLSKNIPLLDFLNYICFLGLSITTLYTADVTAMEKLKPALGAYANFAPIIALAIALFVASIFDADLRKHFILACQVFTAKDWRDAKMSMKSIAIFFLFLAVVRIGLSGGATFVSSIFIADDLVEDGDVEGLEKMLQQKEQTKQTLALQFNSQINEARATAERNAKSVVSEAISSGPKRWQKLYNEKNGWFLSGGKSRDGQKNAAIVAYLQRIATAQRKAQRLRNDAEKQAETLVSTQRNALQREQTDTAFMAVVGIKERQVVKAENKEWVLTIGLLTWDLVMALFAVLSSIALAAILPCRPDYVMFREETSATTIIREFFLSIWRILKSYGVWVVSWIDGKAEGVVESVGATVTIAGRTVALQRRNVTATQSETVQEDEKTSQETDEKNSSESVANGVSRDYNLIAESLRKAKANVRSYRSKLRKKEGTPSTNQRGLDKWKKRVMELERQLQDFS